MTDEQPTGTSLTIEETHDLDRLEDLADDTADGVEGPARADLLPGTLRRRRRPGRWLVAGALVLTLAGAGGGLWWQQQQQPSAAPTAEVVAEPPASSLFIAVASPDNKVVDGVYYLAEQGSATALYVPGELMADIPTVGVAPFSDSLPVGTDVPGTTFADATGLRVDATWALPMDSMAALIDKVGGVTVDVDVPVSSGSVTLSAGNQQKLTGVQAMTFATWTRTGEAPSAQLSRLGQVTSTLLAALPESRGEIEKLLGSVSGSTTLKADVLAKQLVTLRDSLHGDDFAGALLQTSAAPTAAVPNGVRVDVDSLEGWVDARLGSVRQFVPSSAGTVWLQNASGVAELDLIARRELIDDGFGYQWRGTAEPVQPRTIVLVPTGSREDLAAGATVAKSLGLPQAPVLASPIVPQSQTALVLLGSDFQT